MSSSRPSTAPRRSGRYSKTADVTANIENIDTMNKTSPKKRRGRPPKLRVILSSSSSSSEDLSEEVASECTPPKQRRTKPKAEEEDVPEKPHLSPKQLQMGKLSISDDDEEEATEVRKPKLPNKYQNARQVLNSAATNNMPGREGEFKELHDMLVDCTTTKRSASVYISGQPGTGKTATLTKLLQAEVVQRFDTVYVNCTGISSIGSIYKRICESLGLKVRGNRTEKECHSTIEKHLLGSRHKPLLLILDEIDQLMDKKQTILYTIFEWPSKFSSKLVLISIANALDLTDRMLSRLNLAGELKPTLMHFQPYTKKQICDIFNERLKEAGVMHIFPPVTIQLLAAKVAAVSGDVRRALDIGRRVIEIAEQQEEKNGDALATNLLNELGIAPLEQSEVAAAKPVQVNQVVSVLNNVYGASQALNQEIDDSYPLQQKIGICALLLIMRNEKNKDLSLGRLHDVYRRICSKRNLNAVDQMEFVGLCELIETRGLLKIIKKKEPRLSKIRLQWDEDEVRTALQDKQLIAAILSDTGPLNSR